MKDIYEILPDVILYLLIGFVYLKVYRFTSITQTTKKASEFAIECLIVGFALKFGYDFIPSINIYFDLMGMFIASVIIGYLSARLLSNKFVGKILEALHIKQTRNQFIWQDICGDKVVFATLIDYERDIYYFGKIVLIEGFEREPKILLAEYRYEHNNKTIDYTSKPEEAVLIDTSKFTDIWLSYQEDDEKVLRWKSK